MQLNFDATNVAPSSAPVPLETGWYPANIMSTAEVPTKAADGSAFLEIKHRISSGPSAGKIMTSRHNLKNSNPTTVEIAYGELSAICHAVGKLRVQHAAELHGGPLEIYVKKVQRKDANKQPIPGEWSNDVAGFRAIGAAGSQPGFTGAQGTQVAAAPQWAAPAPAAPVAAAPAQPTWAPPPAAAAPPQQYAPQPAPPAAPAAPAGAGSVPPWAR